MRNYQWLSVVEKKSYLNSRSLTWFDNFGRSEKRFFFFRHSYSGSTRRRVFPEKVPEKVVFLCTIKAVGRGVGLWGLHFDLQWGLVSGGMHCQMEQILCLYKPACTRVSGTQVCKLNDTWLERWFSG